MAIRVAATLASAFGGITLLACLVVVPSLLNEIQSIREELDMEMGTFRVRHFLSRISSADGDV